MAAFTYKAVDSTGRKQQGIVEATSPSGARQALRERNLLPVSIETTGAGAEPSSRARPSLGHLFRPAIGTRGLALITRQLATLVGSDVRIEDALRTVANQTSSTRAASVLLNVRAGIVDGRTFASVLDDYPAAFPGFYRASIAAGEQSGRLATVLSHLADFVGQQQHIRQKVQLALLYPALLAMVSISMVTLLLIYVIPDIVRVFLSRGADLPLLTRGLIALSHGVSAYGWAVALALILLSLLARRWLVKPANRIAFHRFLMQRPPVARFSRHLNSAQFSGTLATLVQSGVPLVEALTAASAVTPNLYFRSRTRIATDRVREGTSFLNAISEADCFPPMFVAVAASGESSGELGPALARAATDQERELEAWVSTLVALVEPAVLLFMGGIVLLLVLSILLPIINLNNLAGL